MFETFSALGVHRRHCDGGSWRCGWCECKRGETSGRGPGPDGPGSLCSACSSRFRAGHTSRPSQNANGRFICPKCDRDFETIAALGVHGRHCNGGTWRCEWCSCSREETSGRGPGPTGSGTLCSACASRYRQRTPFSHMSHPIPPISHRFIIRFLSLLQAWTARATAKG